MELSRLTWLGQVVRDLNGAQDVDTLTHAVVAQVAQAVSATAGLLALLEPGPVPERQGSAGGPGPAAGSDLVLAGHYGTPGIAALGRGHVPLGSRVPPADAVRTGVPVILLDRRSVLDAYPVLESTHTEALAAFPLRDGAGHVLGSLALRFEDPGSAPDPTEIAWLQIVADVCAQTLVRLRAQELGATRLAQLQFLSDASEQLAASLDFRSTLTAVARLAAGSVADLCGVQLLEGGRLRSLVVAHADPEQEQLLHQFLLQVPANTRASQGAYRVLRSGRSELFSPLTPEVIARTNASSEFLRMAQQLQLRSALVVPLSARDRTLGTMTLGSTGRLFDVEDVDFAEDLARRSAVAIDNAHLYSRAQRAVLSLREALLPETPPELKGWEHGVLYQPSEGGEIGGDFFDVVPLSADRHIVVLGDVMGRGVDAAAVAVRVKAAVRTLVVADARPTAVADGLDRLFEVSGEDHFVTMALLFFDRAAEVVDVLVAGQVPPCVVRADGTAVRWSGVVHPPFGVGPVDRFAEPFALARGDTVLLYTDGLVERRDEDVDTGIDRLSAVVAHSVPEDREHLETFLRRLARRMRPPGGLTHDDDVTIVAVRRLE